MLLHVPLLAALSALPLAFEPNLGQLPRGVAFAARGQAATVWVDGRGFTVLGKGSSASLRVELVGARAATLAGEAPLPGTVNVFQGSDPAQWHAAIPTFRRVRGAGVYPGVDWIVTGDPGDLEFQFALAPGADASRIRFALPGARAGLAADGSLRVRTGSGRVTLRAPDAGRTAVAYVRHGDGTYSLRLGAHDPAVPLLIDPVLEYSTLLGGNGLDQAFAVALDHLGNVYVAGATSSSNLPVNPFGKYDAGEDAFVAKLDPTASSLLYSAYLGGMGDDGSRGIAVDGSGAAYVTGVTESPDFPVRNAVQSTWGQRKDAFVTKLSPAGSSLVYSTYLGSPQDDVGRDIAVDGAGNAYVVGCAGTSAFPTWMALRATTPSPDAFVTKLNPAGGQGGTFSTLLGGSGYDCASGVALDGIGAIYVTGQTASRDFPLQSAFQTSYADAGVASFVTKLAPNGQSYAYSTFLSGSYGSAVTAGVAVDGNGSAYVVGQTYAQDYPVTDGGAQPKPAGGYDGFITKLSPDGRSLGYSSYLGGSNADAPTRVAVTPEGVAYVVGWTASAAFPSFNALPGEGRGQPVDAFITVYNVAGSGYIYSTLLGGSGDDLGRAIALGPNGSVWVVGDTSSLDFPYVDGGFQSAFAKGQDGGGDHGFVSLVALPAPTLGSVVPDGGPTQGGTAVTLYGANLMRGGTLLFGNAPATYALPSPSNMQATSPQHAAGVVDITFINPDGKQVVAPGAFTYFGASAVITPASVTVDAGEGFVLDGTGSSAAAGALLTAFTWGEPQGPAYVALDGGPTQHLVLAQPGAYVFSLQVSDTAGTTSPPATAAVLVRGPTEVVPDYRFGCGCGHTAGGEGAWALFALAAATEALRARRASARASLRCASTSRRWAPPA